MLSKCRTEPFLLTSNNSFAESDFTGNSMIPVLPLRYNVEFFSSHVPSSNLPKSLVYEPSGWRLRKLAGVIELSVSTALLL
jgi:hypothetical protein